jgi:nucleotide-binding universal stress UspA family protein
MLLNDHFNVAEYVQQTAAAEQSDLIITGAKGHSGLSGFVFGSVTEKLIAASERPVMVIR